LLDQGLYWVGCIQDISDKASGAGISKELPDRPPTNVDTISMKIDMVHRSSLITTNVWTISMKMNIFSLHVVTNKGIVGSRKSTTMCKPSLETATTPLFDFRVMKIMHYTNITQYPSGQSLATSNIKSIQIYPHLAYAYRSKVQYHGLGILQP
jgi:hypothetical protein